MRKRSIILLSLLTVFFILNVNASLPCGIVNGTFDSGLNPWAYSGGTSSHNGTFGRSANSSARVTQTGSASTILYQNITNTSCLTSGDRYRFEAYFFIEADQTVGDGYNVSAFMSVGEGVGTIEKRYHYNISNEELTSGVWTNLSTLFIYNDSTDLIVGLYANGSNASGGGYVYWDDAQIVNYTVSGPSGGKANTSCGNISNSIIINNNITYPNGTCFHVDADSITIFCNGSYFIGNNSGYLFNITGRSNIVINNCSNSINFTDDFLVHTSDDVKFANFTSIVINVYNSTNLSVELSHFNCSYGFYGADITKPVDWEHCKFNVTVDSGGVRKIESFEAKWASHSQLIALAYLGIAGLLDLLMRRIGRRRR